jgi:hypothetical protein
LQTITLSLYFVVLPGYIVTPDTSPADITPDTSPADITPDTSPADVTPDTSPADITPDTSPADTVLPQILPQLTLLPENTTLSLVIRGHLYVTFGLERPLFLLVVT